LVSKFGSRRCSDVICKFLQFTNFRFGVASYPIAGFGRGSGLDCQVPQFGSRRCPDCRARFPITLMCVWEGRCRFDFPNQGFMGFCLPTHFGTPPFCGSQTNCKFAPTCRDRWNSHAEEVCPPDQCKCLAPLGSKPSVGNARTGPAFWPGQFGLISPVPSHQLSPPSQPKPEILTGVCEMIVAPDLMKS
jgi:hypothetical protein